MRNINLIVVHCSATREDKSFTEFDLDDCHRRRGFNGTGYHFYPGCRVCGHRDLSPDLNGNGEIEPEEWVKACPCFEVKVEYSKDFNKPSEKKEIM